MSVNNVIPDLKASGNISPCRAVAVSGVMLGAQTTAATQNIVGVTDSSTKAFDSVYNATAGTQINFGSKFWFQWECGAAVTVGTDLTTDSSGRAITATVDGSRIYAVACETGGAAGDFIWCYWAPTVLTTGFLTAVATDATLTGDGTAGDPLSVV